LDDYLRAKGHENIFVNGDAGFVERETNRATFCDTRATNIGANILSLIDRQKPAQIYKQIEHAPVLCTLGPHKGQSLLPGGIMAGSSVTAAIKGGDMLLGKVSQDLGFVEDVED